MGRAGAHFQGKEEGGGGGSGGAPFQVRVGGRAGGGGGGGGAGWTGCGVAESFWLGWEGGWSACSRRLWEAEVNMLYVIPYRIISHIV